MSKARGQEPSDESGRINQAVVLAGGLGTRLRAMVLDLPKCMAPVAGKPFLSYVMDHLAKQGIEKFIVSLGYKHEEITKYLDAHFKQGQIAYSIEKEPLGTGGAILLACGLATTGTVVVVNGDTFFAADLGALSRFHRDCQSTCTLCLKPMRDFSRYGAVELGEDHSIRRFLEKKKTDSGLINAGVYALQTKSFARENLPEKFSFEKDYLEKFHLKRPMFGLVQDKYFIDIGIPEDYLRAQKDLIRHI
jgi:D-glycero-alpha-D-manno-heptose 1-phosphate guanylyltransferase